MKRLSSNRVGIPAAIVLAAVVSAGPAAGSIRQGTVEFVLGKYNVDEPRFARIYPESGSVRGLVLSSTLFFNFNLYLDIRHFSRTGTLTHTKEKTVFHLVPVSIGLRFVAPLKYIHPYVGGGGDVYYYYEDNVIDTVLNSAKGWHLLGGVYVHPWDTVPLALNLRVKYTKVTAVEEGQSIGLGGVEYGAAFVIVF